MPVTSQPATHTTSPAPPHAGTCHNGSVRAPVCSQIWAPLQRAERARARRGHASQSQGESAGTDGFCSFLVASFPPTLGPRAIGDHVLLALLARTQPAAYVSEALARPEPDDLYEQPERPSAF